MKLVDKTKTQSGFTLIEMGIALSIVGVLGVAANQTVRLNALRRPSPATLPACSANLALVDNNANVLNSSIVSLTPGQAKSITLSADPTAVELVYGGAFRANTNSCDSREIVATFELVDSHTGSTLVALPAVQ
jgi:prepilin-type N-terminal cleavage/methylation domain-containing protein